MSFAFENTRCISLIFKLVPVQYRVYEYGQLGVDWSTPFVIVLPSFINCTFLL